MNLNWTLIAGVFVLLLLGALIWGAINIVWGQRKSGDIPASFRWAGGNGVILIFVIGLVFAAPQFVFGIGSFAQNLFTNSGQTTQLPDYGNLLNGGGDSQSSGGGQQLNMPGMSNDQRGGGGQ